MKHFLFLISALILSVAPVKADEAMQATAHKSIEIMNPYSFATSKAQKNGAAFMKITNHSDAADKLISVSLPETIADHAEIHFMGMEEGSDVMRMREIEHIEITPNGTAVLKPMSYHIMLMGLKEPLEEGQTFDLTLGFENAGEQSVSVTVIPPGMMKDHEGHGGHDENYISKRRQER